MPQDIDDEIEKLKLRKMELAQKLNFTSDFEEKEELRLDIQRVHNQIETLEKYKKKF